MKWAWWPVRQELVTYGVCVCVCVCETELPGSGLEGAVASENDSLLEEKCTMLTAQLAPGTHSHSLARLIGGAI